MARLPRMSKEEFHRTLLDAAEDAGITLAELLASAAAQLDRGLTVDEWLDEVGSRRPPPESPEIVALLDGYGVKKPRL